MKKKKNKSVWSTEPLIYIYSTILCLQMDEYSKVETPRQIKQQLYPNKTDARQFLQG